MSPKDTTRMPINVKNMASTCTPDNAAPCIAQLSIPITIPFVPAMETTAPATPRSIPMNKYKSAPAAKMAAQNTISCFVSSTSKMNHPNKDISIHPAPKMKSAKKLIFMKTTESILLVQYLERMILLPMQVAAIKDPIIITMVAPLLPLVRDTMSTPPKFIKTPKV